MATMSTSLVIDAPRERVFELLADLSVRPSFCGHFITRFHLQRIDPVGVGASARFQIDTGRRELWMETVISETEPPFRIVESGRGGRGDRIAFGTAWRLVEVGAGTEVTVVFWSEESNAFDRLLPPGVAGRRSRRRWSKALTRLKEIAEGEAAVERVHVAGGPRIALRA